MFITHAFKKFPFSAYMQHPINERAARFRLPLQLFFSVLISVTYFYTPYALARKHVVIVGGGAAGATAAYKLQKLKKKNFDITLIDPKDFYEIPLGIPRNYVEPQFTTKSLVPYEYFFNEAKHLQAHVTKVEANQVHFVRTVNGEPGPVEQLKFNYLILATGAPYPKGKLRATGESLVEREKFYIQQQRDIQKAEHVLVVGGGAAGVEIMGELLTTFPGKTITLAHPHDQLLSSAADRVSKEFPGKVLKLIQNHGGTVRLNSRVSNVSGKQVTFSNGEIMQADHIIWAGGSKPQLAYLRDNFPNAITPQNRVRTTDSLNLLDAPHIFVAGDISDTGEPNLAAVAMKQAKFIVDQLKKLDKSPEAKLSTYKASTRPPTVLSFGKNKGIGVAGGFSIPGPVIARVKSRNLFVPNLRKNLGLKGEPSPTHVQERLAVQEAL